MSVLPIIMICFCVSALTVNITGPILMPDEYPINYYETAGWVLFLAAWIMWGIAR